MRRVARVIAQAKNVYVGKSQSACSGAIFVKVDSGLHYNPHCIFLNVTYGCIRVSLLVYKSSVRAMYNENDMCSKRLLLV